MCKIRGMRIPEADKVPSALICISREEYFSFVEHTEFFAIQKFQEMNLI